MRLLANFRAHDGFERWQRWTEWPLVVLGLAFLAVLILPLATPLTSTESRVLDIANVGIWLAFAVDYFLRLYLTQDRRGFVRGHVLDLIVICVPFLRPFRLIRLLAILISTTRRAGGLAVRRVTLYVIGTAVILASVGAVLVYDAEKAVPESERTIKTIGDAFWWALITVTTIGYGDVFPRSATGRAFASVLMIMGIALIGTLTAALASWFVSLVKSGSSEAGSPEPDPHEQGDYSRLLGELRQVNETLADLRSEMNELQAGLYSPALRGVPISVRTSQADLERLRAGQPAHGSSFESLIQPANESAESEASR